MFAAVHGQSVASRAVGLHPHRVETVRHGSAELVPVKAHWAHKAKGITADVVRSFLWLVRPCIQRRLSPCRRPSAKRCPNMLAPTALESRQLPARSAPSTRSLQRVAKISSRWQPCELAWPLTAHLKLPSALRCCLEPAYCRTAGGSHVDSPGSPRGAQGLEALGMEGGP